MKYWCLSIALFANAPPVYSSPLYTPRPLDAWAAESLERGLKQSPLVRNLVDVLEASNVIVHIETSTLLPAGIGGMTKFVTSQHGYRYVRIILFRGLAPYDRVAALGHEFQHACEIARSTAQNQEEVRRLFELLGDRRPNQHDFFETHAAVLAGHQVYMELVRKRDSRSGTAGTK